MRVKSTGAITEGIVAIVLNGKAGVVTRRQQWHWRGPGVTLPPLSRKLLYLLFSFFLFAALTAGGV